MVIEISGIIFLDLDGTLLDTSTRHYKLYQDILDKKGVSKSILSAEKFWSMKQAGVKTHGILPEFFREESISSFEKEWLQKIEKKDYLQHDKLFPGIKDILFHLNKEFDLVLVTLRNNSENLHWELSKLGLKSYFKSIISGKGPKTELIENYLMERSRDRCIIVGDTEEDIKTGLQLEITTISVTCGIRSRAFLENFNPDFCIDSLHEIIDIINF